MMTGIGYLRRLGQGLRSMKHPTPMKLQEGKMGYILLWLLGVPIPILLVIFSCAAACHHGLPLYETFFIVSTLIASPLISGSRSRVVFTLAVVMDNCPSCLMT